MAVKTFTLKLLCWTYFHSLFSDMDSSPQELEIIANVIRLTSVVTNYQLSLLILILELQWMLAVGWSPCLGCQGL